MPDVIINFKAQITGEDEVQAALVNQGKLEKSVVDQVNAANKAFAEQQKAIGGTAKETDKLAASLKNLPKSLVGGGIRDMTDLAKSVKDGTLQINALATAIDLSKKKLAELAPESKAYKTLQSEISASLIVNDRLNKSFTSSRAEIKAMQQALLQLEDAGFENTKVFQDLSLEAAKLTDQVGDAQARIKTLASDTFKFDAAIGAVTGLTAAFSVGQGVIGLFGTESEEIQKTLLKVNAAMAVLTGLQQIQNTIQKQTAVTLAVENALRRIGALSTALQAAAESKFIIVRVAATAAQNALNAAMAANPATVLLIAIGALAAGLLYLTTRTDKEAEAQAELARQLEFTNQSLRNQVAIVDSLAEADNRQLQRLAAGGAKANVIRSAGIGVIEQQIRRQVELIERLREQSGVEQEFDDANKKLNELRSQREIKTLEDQRLRAEEAKEISKKAFEDSKKSTEDFLKDQIAANQAAVIEAKNGFDRLVAQIEVINAKLRLTLANRDLGQNERLQAELEAGQAIIKARQDMFSGFEQLETKNTAAFKTGLNDQVLKSAQANQQRLNDEQSAADARLAIAEDELQKRIAIQQRLSSLSVNTALSLASSLNEIAQNQANEDLAILQKKYDDGIISQEQFEQEQRNIRRRAAVQEKALALFQASIAQSLAVLAVLKDQTIPIPLKPVFIALTVAQAVAQLAAIASRPIPAFAKGTKNAPGGKSLIGEAGGELYHQNGKWGYAASATIIDLRKGAKVIPAKQSDQILRDYNIPIPGLPQHLNTSQAPPEMDYNKLARAMGKEIAQIPVQQHFYDEYGITIRQTKMAQRANYQKTRYSSGRV